MKLKNAIVGFICIVVTLGLKAQSPDPEQSIAKTAITRLANQIRNAPQEKVYLQLDKPNYAAGEKIWLRAYMVHSAIHIPLDLSRYIYVELINQKDEVVDRKKIHQIDKNVYFGQIDLSPEIANGWYSIRAYTNYMRNISEDFFFRKKVLITNSLKKDENQLSEELKNLKSTDTKNKNNTTSSLDVQFFPEGGHLIAGTTQTIGIKAIASNGLGISIKGQILDSKGKVVTTFQTERLGMGKFELNTLKDEKYTASYQSDNGEKFTCSLPEVSIKNMALRVVQSDTSLQIKILTPNQAKSKETLYLIGTLRGFPIFQKAVDPDMKEISIPKQNFNSGIAQVYLINSNYAVLSERNLFIRSNDNPIVDLKLNKANYLKRDSVVAKLVIKDSKGAPVKASLSVSVTDDNDILIDPNAMTIKSYLLLQSDIRGTIEEPGSYFRENNLNAASQLDALLLTQAWKRYDTQAALLENYQISNQYEVEVGPVISGNVRSFSFKRPLANNNVSLFLSGNKLFFDGVLTDKNGNFQFNCPDFPDSTKIRLEASRKDLQLVELRINPDSFPKVEQKASFSPIIEMNKQFQSFSKKTRDKWNLENGSLSIMLSKVEIVAKKRDKNQQIRETEGFIFSAPSYSIDEEQIRAYNNTFDLLCSAPTVTMNSTGEGVLVQNEAPLILVNGLEYTNEEVRTLNTSEIKMVDIIRDAAQTALFSANGRSVSKVIFIYLKRASDFKDEIRVKGTNEVEIFPLGYTKPAEFYVPKYNVYENRRDPMPDLRTTIYWQPSVKSDENGFASFNFFTADDAGTYTMILEGVTPTGELIHFEKVINRK